MNYFGVIFFMTVLLFIDHKRSIAVLFFRILNCHTVMCLHYNVLYHMILLLYPAMEFLSYNFMNFNFHAHDLQGSI